MTQMRAGIAKTFQGLRTGDQRTLFTGVALVIFSVWRRGSGTRELVYRRVLREDEALMIKTGTRSGSRVVVSADLADQVKSLSRNRASAKSQ